MRKPQLLQAVEQLYEASLWPGRWPAALEALATACGATGATVFRLPTAAERALTTANLAEVTDAYARIWWAYDSRARRMAPMGAATGPLTDADLLSREERSRDPFYQDFLRAYGLGDFAAVTVAPVAGTRLAVTVERGSGPFEREEIEAFALLSRHAAQAAAAAVRLQVTERFATELAHAADHVAAGLIFIDAEGRVGFVNDLGRRMLGDGLSIAGEHLKAANPADQWKLDRLIAALLPGSRLPSGESLFISRPSGRSPLVVQGHPIGPRTELPLEQLGVSGSGGFLILHDLAADRPRSVAHDLQRMGLSRAQARVAEHVGRGDSVKEAAERLGIAESTARTQLKAAYARLCIGRQSELAILVTKLSALRLS
jgi:DNA-binding CsgD family transcriptional regulator